MCVWGGGGGKDLAGVAGVRCVGVGFGVWGCGVCGCRVWCVGVWGVWV